MASVLIVILTATIYYWDILALSLPNAAPLAPINPTPHTIDHIPNASEAPGAATTANNAVTKRQQVPLPSASSPAADAIAPTTTAINVPPDVIELIKECYRHGYQGNTEYAALLAIEAAEKSSNNPSLAAQMRYMAGQYYEKLNYLPMAKQQYALALLQLPEHKNSYRAMRRIDPAFARENPALSTDKASPHINSATGKTSLP